MRLDSIKATVTLGEEASDWDVLNVVTSNLQRYAPKFVGTKNPTNILVHEVELPIRDLSQLRGRSSRPPVKSSPSTTPPKAKELPQSRKRSPNPSAKASPSAPPPKRSCSGQTRRDLTPPPKAKELPGPNTGSNKVKKNHQIYDTNMLHQVTSITGQERGKPTWTVHATP